MEFPSSIGGFVVLYVSDADLKCEVSSVGSTSCHAVLESLSPPGLCNPFIGLISQECLYARMDIR
jgi:hypothetical protein